MTPQRRGEREREREGDVNHGDLNHILLRIPVEIVVSRDMLGWIFVIRSERECECDHTSIICSKRLSLFGVSHHVFHFLISQIKIFLSLFFFFLKEFITCGKSTPLYDLEDERDKKESRLYLVLYQIWPGVFNVIIFAKRIHKVYGGKCLFAPSTMMVE